MCSKLLISFGDKFSLFGVFMTDKKERETSKPILFSDSVTTLLSLPDQDCVVHIMCQQGAMSLLFQQTHFNVIPGDYVILPSLRLAKSFAESSDFKGIVMALESRFVMGLTLKSNYGVTGHLSLLQNPVMKLNKSWQKRCETDLERIKNRSEEFSKRFGREMIEHLLMAHILDLYEIHAQSHQFEEISDRNADLLNRFITLLMNGDFKEHRDLDYYAEKLFVTAHYLSEVCRRVSGKGAYYFIERFTVQEITALLRDKRYTLSEIVELMNFSSISYFSRYVRQKTGMTPSEFRKNNS